jgi:hypothetical protein
MNFANAIRPKTNRHSSTNTAMLFVGIGRLSGNPAVGSIGDTLIAWNETAITGQVLTKDEARRIAANINCP